MRACAESDQQTGVIVSSRLCTLSVPEDTTLTVPLTDAEIIEDIRMMVHDWHDLCDQYHLSS